MFGECKYRMAQGPSSGTWILLFAIPAIWMRETGEAWKNWKQRWHSSPLHPRRATHAAWLELCAGNSRVLLLRTASRSEGGDRPAGWAFDGLLGQCKQRWRCSPLHPRRATCAAWLELCAENVIQSFVADFVKKQAWRPMYPMHKANSIVVPAFSPFALHSSDWG